jgi:hypothetical protein
MDIRGYVDVDVDVDVGGLDMPIIQSNPIHSEPYPCHNNTQQPCFSMEFLGGNDCSSIALMALIIYSSLGPASRLRSVILLCSALLCAA